MPKLAWVQSCATDNVIQNLAVVAQQLNSLIAKKPDIVVLPEAFAWLAKDITAQATLVETLGEQAPLQSFCQEWAKRLGCFLVVGSLPLRINGRIYATLCVYDALGQMVTYYRKMHLFAVTTPTGRVYQESSFFTQGSVPVIWYSPWGPIGLAICYDVRFPALFQYYAQHDVRCVILPAAFTYETGKQHWHHLVSARAIENQLIMVAVNQTGSHGDGLRSYGHSLLVDAWGETLVDSGDRLTVECVDVAFEPVDELRAQFPVLLHARKFVW
ncbi:MAG: hypothetical protein JHC38_08145 [Thiotrichales bacterium]|jgi:nitrilase|nr:hypothetical protein [Thiotrichales bacterium]